MPTLEFLNHLSPSDAQAELFRCCGSEAWSRAVTQARPFADERALYETADQIWAALTEKDWLEAFGHHPRIGELSGAPSWAQEEQGAAKGAPESLMMELLQANRAYEKHFGHIFLVCATGKTAPQMLALLKTRMGNDPSTELKVAAAEQAKITRIRLEKWLNT